MSVGKGFADRSVFRRREIQAGWLGEELRAEAMEKLVADSKRKSSDLMAWGGFHRYRWAEEGIAVIVKLGR